MRQDFEPSFVVNTGISEQGIFITDANGKILQINKAFTEITGFSSEDVLGQSPALWRSGVHDKYFYQTLWQQVEEYGIWYGYICNKNKQGELYTEWLTISALKNDQGIITHYMAVYANGIYSASCIHGLKLSDRHPVVLELAHLLNESARHETGCALFMLDLKGLESSINSVCQDRYERLLPELVQYLRSEIPEHYLFAPLEPSLFVLLKPDAGTLTAASFVHRLLERLSAFLFDGEQYSLDARIGVALYPADAQNNHELLNCAYQAVKQSEVNGYRFYQV